MSDIDDPEYYQRREALQRRFAAVAQDPAISRIHTDLAELYAGQVQRHRPRLRFAV